MMALVEVPAAAPQGGWRRWTLPALAVAAVPCVGYLYSVDPNQPGGYPLCPTYALGGFYCPGCGFLRASHALLHGDVAGALARNPLIPVLAVLCAYWAFRWARARVRGRSLNWIPNRHFAPVLAGTLVLFTIARNVPGWSLLSPI